MLRNFESIDIKGFRLALTDERVNAITFPEPLRPENLPYFPNHPLEPYQFWFVQEDWGSNWNKFETSLSEHFNALAASIGRRCRTLLEIFSELTEDQVPFVSLRSITPEYFKETKASVSAGWHRDASVLTLQDTLMGEPLEYTHDDNVRREYFDKTQIQPFHTLDSAVLYRPEEFETIAHGCVAILKGEMRSDEQEEETLDFLSHFIDIGDIKDFNRGHSLIHRGHKNTKNGRLVLTVSTHKIPAWIP